MSLYEYFKQKIVPPTFLIGFTASVQFLALIGRGEPFKWEAILSALSGNLMGWTIVAVIFTWAYLWMILSREQIKEDTSPNGYIHSYKGNAVSYYIITVLTFLCAQRIWPNLSNNIFNNMPEILGTLNIISFALNFYLYYRSKEGAQLPRLYVFYIGRQIHPKVLGVDVKQLIICRAALIIWQVQVFAFFFAALDKRSFDVATLVTGLLQTAYLFKAFIYESAYFHSLDFTLDRAGYYLIWGSLVWLPCLYSFNSYFLVNHPPVISYKNAIVILIFGIISIIATLLVDFEKARFRRNNGNTLIWNKKPTYIVAKYTDHAGAEKTSLLLTSGSWGLARHLNYTFELLSNLSWALPALGLGISGYIPIMFLTVFLFHRIYRDESKCKAKYGKYWEEYCKKVPYRLVPYFHEEKDLTIHCSLSIVTRWVYTICDHCCKHVGISLELGKHCPRDADINWDYKYTRTMGKSTTDSESSSAKKKNDFMPTIIDHGKLKEIREQQLLEEQESLRKAEGLRPPRSMIGAAGPLNDRRGVMIGRGVRQIPEETPWPISGRGKLL